ncbi:ciliogenesis and planar polarity effector 2 [Callorhinchus milii]|uniref:Ciliogenesis and planar polarity effector 2 n=1 Tax=Callorhinchus milii TaxID=7868 RepID=A0A4W3HLP8_CALMI|nr:ciliogenesis and planar polarity effector 2 [Callorhinchus milii]XP_042199699.1 ciliogenesis and planar polarity effector 2 [Callorhinchus milii]|eukprot:gi/632977564/ref/XP_007905417.1/ PREDICTED: REM2- and Rab-like small GTPase 1 [Callorhinchus milii]
MLLKPGSLIAADWHLSADSREHLTSILRRNKRKMFGLLERPVLPPKALTDTACYKIFLSGKSGVGKTATVAKLAGSEISSTHYETPGIQTRIVYWPGKLKETGRVIMFSFQFWDCGEAALKKFDHILPACKDKVDAILFLFSFTDRSSFDDLPNQMSRIVDNSDKITKIIIGTKFDQYMHTDVTERDLREFQQTWHLPIFRMKNVNGPWLSDGKTVDGKAGLLEVAHILNGLAEHLWYQDQVTAGLVPPPHHSHEQRVSPC